MESRSKQIRDVTRILLAGLFAALWMAVAAGEAHAGPTANGSHAIAPLAHDCGSGTGPGGLGVPGDCYRLRIRCTTNSGDAAFPVRFRPPASGGLEYADAVVRQTGGSPSNQPLGGVVFFTGSDGNFFYGDVLPYATTTVATVGISYTTFEVKWLDANPAEKSRSLTVVGNPIGTIDQMLNPGHGYVSGSEGYGADVASCGVREVLEWISLNRTPTGNQKVCATGNSGGGMQIAYALTIYGGADFLKSAVISGGPSYARIFNGCFGPEYNNGLNAAGNPSGTPASLTLGFPYWHPGRQFIEATMGWPAHTCVSPTDPVYTQDPNYADDTRKRRFARRSSLVPAFPDIANDDRNYAALDSAGIRTHQLFVRGTSDLTGAQVQGNTYILRALEDEGFVTVKDVLRTDPLDTDFLQHEIYNTAHGSLQIQDFLTMQNACTY